MAKSALATLNGKFTSEDKTTLRRLAGKKKVAEADVFVTKSDEKRNEYCASMQGQIELGNRIQAVKAEAARLGVTIEEYEEVPMGDLHVRGTPNAIALLSSIKPVKRVRHVRESA